MRVITYSDPREIEKIKDWEVICRYPHLCVSQTLVQGLSRKCRRDKFKVLTTIDKFIKEFYGDWKMGSELSIKQFFEVTDLINKIEEVKIRNVFYKNRTEVIKALRLLIESNVDLNELNTEIKTIEFIEFYKIYSEIKKSNNWNVVDYSRDKGIEGVKTIFESITLDEIKNELELLLKIKNSKLVKVDNLNKEEILKIYNGIPKEGRLSKRRISRKSGESEEEICIKRIDNAFSFIDNLNGLKLEKIVIHGVHQFTPIILRLIKDLESMGLEIIFLLNYNKDFESIYETWGKVYKWTECDFEYNQINTEKYAKGIAKDFANIILARLDEVQGSDDECIVFENLTEFGNYVADVYDTAKKQQKEKDRGKDKTLSLMREQFYSVNGESINNLLSTYFPEQFGQKHFLSYPIGQFILGLYNMWDFKKGKILIDENIIRECFGVNLWIKDENITPIEIYEQVKSYFIGINDIDEYIREIDSLIKYSKVLKGNRKYREEYENYKHLSFFRIETKYIEIFKMIIIDLKNIGEKLFKNSSNINVKSHFKDLLNIIKERTENNDNISEAEYTMVNEILSTLEAGGDMEISSVEEVSNVLHFYLNEKSEVDTSNWIVRDFEQIDGGVFLGDDEAKEARVGEKNSIYHYAEVSDSNMSNSKKKELPWPLCEDYFTEDNEIIKVYLTCREEYTNFLKSALFYGMYYLNRKIKISYIKSGIDNKEEELYFMFKILNTKENPYYISDKALRENITLENRNTTELVNKEEINKEQGQMMSFCKRRFYYEGLFDKEGSFKDSFLSIRFIKVLMLLKVVDTFNRKGIWYDEKKQEDEIEDRLNKMCNLIKAWEYEKNDIKAYVKSNIIRYKNYYLKDGYVSIDSSYQEIKKNYIDMKFTEEVDGKEINHNVDKCNYESSLNRYRQSALEYINLKTKDRIDSIKEKCKVCKYRDICSNVYRERG